VGLLAGLFVHAAIALRVVPVRWVLGYDNKEATAFWFAGVGLAGMSKA